MIDKADFIKNKNLFKYDLIVPVSDGDHLSLSVRWNEDNLQWGSWYWHPTGYKIGDGPIKKARFHFMNKDDCFMFLLKAA